MTNEQLAQKYANRLNKCLAAIKILMICVMVAIAALVIFAFIALGLNMQKSNPEGLLLGVIIPGFTAAACIIGVLATIITAKIAMNGLKKLGTDKS